MTTYDLLSGNNDPGSELRNQAANFLAAIYGRGIIEYRSAGKKADAYFEASDLGRSTRIYVESKDYKNRLSRKEVVHIWSDYSGVIERSAPARLLLVTRNGLTTDAESFVQEQPNIRHLTIWELENEVLGMTSYLRTLVSLFDDDGLSSYYVPAKASYIGEAEGTLPFDLLDAVQLWLTSSPSEGPLAILGGYGAGKTSFSRMLAAKQATLCLSDPTARKPVLVKLGSIARYSSLSGLLGDLFTSQHSVAGYSYAKLLAFNQRGRLLIILDGFDEMKHAMSWGDFRSQLQELNQLVVPNSRVILLGRPSAFLSEAEYEYALKGLRKGVENVVSVPDWPKFKELVLASFTRDNISDFARRYLLCRASTGDLPLQETVEEWVATRIEALASVVSADKDLFSRPVHLKLAADIVVAEPESFSRLEHGVSKWSLYETFFSMLIERENLKDARKPLSDDQRFTFIQRIARWLWAEREGQTSFNAADIPAYVLDDIAKEVDVDGKAREFLTGSFLEKKDGDIFYFPHRSFAEFLVARSICHSPTVESDHAIYSRIIRGGVAEFLYDKGCRFAPPRFMESLAFSKFFMNIDYITFICKAVSSAKAVSQALPTSSHWRGLFYLIGEADQSPRRFYTAFVREVVRAGDLGAAVLLEAMCPNGYFAGFPVWNPSDAATASAAAILERAFLLKRFPDTEPTILIRYCDAGEDYDLAKAALSGPSLANEQVTMQLNWRSLLRNLEDRLWSAGCGIVYSTSDGPPSRSSLRIESIDVQMADILRLVQPSISRDVHEFFIVRRKTMAHILAVDDEDFEGDLTRVGRPVPLMPRIPIDETEQAAKEEWLVEYDEYYFEVQEEAARKDES